MATLYVVGTPIGNLADITPRAVEILRSVDLVVGEDTRQTGVLLKKYGIETRLASYHQHSGVLKIDWLIEQLSSGKDLALVTDAGTPGISDPGGVFVEQVHLLNARLASDSPHRIEVVAIPGPSALTAGLSVSGLPADHFIFLGFLPKKKGRQTLLKQIADWALRVKGSNGASWPVETVAFYESAIRWPASVGELASYLPVETVVVVGRELTKKFEEVWRGSLEEAVKRWQEPTKGELVIMLGRLDKKVNG